MYFSYCSGITASQCGDVTSLDVEANGDNTKLETSNIQYIASNSKY
jgi:hypothetical protein